MNNLNLDMKSFIEHELNNISLNIDYDPIELLPEKSEDLISQFLKDPKGELCINEQVHIIMHKFIRKARRKKYSKFLCLGAFGMGKCFCKGNQVLTYDGEYKNVEDIKIDDLLMGDDSKPRRVLFLGNGYENAYKITLLSNGDFFSCNESHILSLIFSKDCLNYNKGEKIDINLKEYLELPEWIKQQCLKMYKVAIDFNYQNIPLDPYEYGKSVGNFRNKHGFSRSKFYKIWLHMKERCNNPNVKFYKDYGGRGITYDPRWNDFINFKNDMHRKYIYAKNNFKTNKLSIERLNVDDNYYKDNCIFIKRKDQAKNTRKTKWFEAISPNGNKYISNNQSDFARKYNLSQTHIGLCLRNRVNKCKGWSFNYIDIKKNKIKKFKNQINKKILLTSRIDKRYLKNTQEIRFELLAGIIDYNGHVCQDCYKITTKLYDFKNDFVFLCRSLALNTTVYEEKYKDIIYYKICISGETYKIPTKLKKVIKTKQNKNPNQFSFKVEPIGKKEYFGFGLDGNNRFLLKDFTVAHNSEQLCIGFVLDAIARNPDIFVKIVHVSEKEAINRVRAIGQYIQSDDDYKRLCPHIQPSPIFGQEKFIIQRKSISLNPTVQAFSVLSSSLGGRSHLIIFDDINDLKSAVIEPTTRENIEQMVKTTWETRCIPNESEMICLGNKWHENDIATYIQNNSTWAWMSISVTEDKNNLEYNDCFRNKPKLLPLWTKFPKEELINRHISMGDRDYNRGYRLIAYSDKDKSFPSFESCCEYHVSPIQILGDLREWIFAAGIDFSSPKREGTTFIVGALHRHTGIKVPIEIYALDKPSDLSTKIVETWQKYGIELFLCENNAVQSTIIDLLQSALDASRFRKYNIKLEGFCTGRNKADPNQGIPSIQKEMERGEWKFYFERPFTVNDNVERNLWYRFHTEMKFHPFYKTTDFVMSLWFLRQAFQQLFIKDSISMIY